MIGSDLGHPDDNMVNMIDKSESMDVVETGSRNDHARGEPNRD